MSKTRTIGRNISYLAISRVASLLIYFFLFPFIVKNVGKEVYGIYLIVMTVTGYLGLLDLGVMSALTKYVSEFNGKGDKKSVSNIINASFSFYAIIGILIAIFMFAGSVFAAKIFKISAGNEKVVKDLFLIAAFSSFFVWPLNTFRGTMTGLNLWNIDSLINIFMSLINAVMAFLLLSFGYSITQLFIVSQSLTIIGGIIALAIIVRKTGYKIVFPFADRETLELMFNFSIFMFLGNLMSAFTFQIQNLIIGYFISMSAVTIYAVAYGIQNYFRTINSTLGGPPWTMASEMEGRKDYDGQKKLLFLGTKFMSASIAPLVLIMIVFAEPFIKYWMGKGFEDSVMATRIILIFWIFNATVEISAGMLSVKAIVRQPVLVHTAVAVTNFIIGIAFIKYLGISSLALGLTCSMVLVGFPLFLKMALGALKISLKEYFNKAIKSNLVLYAVSLTISVLALYFLYPINISSTLMEIGIIYAVSLVFYYIIVVTRDEKEYLHKLIGVQAAFNKINYFKERVAGLFFD